MKSAPTTDVRRRTRPWGWGAALLLALASVIPVASASTGAAASGSHVSGDLLLFTRQICTSLCLVTPTSPVVASGPHLQTRIALVRNHNADNSSIHTFDPDGSRQQLISPGDSAHWSHDGRRLDVRRSDSLAATIIDLRTGRSRDLQIPDPDFACGPTTTEQQCAQTDFGCPAWSPDDAHLACSAASGVAPGRSGVYTVRSSDGGHLRRVTLCPNGCGLGEYSPNGRRLVFEAADKDGAFRMATVRLDGTGLRVLTPASMVVNDEYGGSWTARGNRILFAARPAPDHRYALWTVKPDGSNLRRLPVPGCGGALADPASVGCPQADWSPDGRHVVLTRVTASEQAVYTFDLHSLIVRRVSPAGVNDSLPDWGLRP